jgi:hypothetical protein
VGGLGQLFCFPRKIVEFPIHFCLVYNNIDIAVPNSHNITQIYNTKINKYLELSIAMRNVWCLEKKSILPLIISATGIVP